MLRTILPSEMKRVEQKVMAQTAVTSSVLMERAAGYVAQAAASYLFQNERPVLCLCGTGNNGGDGLAAMRLLAGEHPFFQGTCLLLPGSLSPDAALQLEQLQAQAPQVTIWRLTGADLPPLPKRPACVLDALFGTGLSRPLEGMAAKLCQVANDYFEAGVPVVAVDIPSGLNGATGQAKDPWVRATQTVTFHRPKPGLYLGQGMDTCGQLQVADLGLPSELDDGEGLWVLEEKDLPLLLPPRRHDSHKGTYGRVLLWAGSPGMAGAAALCATAALRAGAGLVTVACDERILSTVQILAPCATCLPLPMDDPKRAAERLTRGLEKADVLALGCGLGQSESSARLFQALLSYLTQTNTEHSLPVVIDADGLNLLTKNGLCPPNCFLTPHPAEAARLLGWETRRVTADPVEAAGELRKRFQASVLLKGAASVLAAPEGLGLNVLGTPAMAKGGSGDVLTGVLAALLAGTKAGAYSLTALEALQAACALHGLAGLAAEKRRGQRGVLATDLCDFLGLPEENQ